MTIFWLGAVLVVSADSVGPKEALAPFNVLVGSWKGTGTLDAPKSDKGKEFWTETVTWGWKFKGTDAWLTAAFEGSKHFTSGELRYLPGTKTFRLTVTTPEKQSLVYTGPLAVGRNKESILTLERTEGVNSERLVWTLPHHNRHLYRLDAKTAAGGAFVRRWQVGATKEGEPFASLPNEKECVVSGGRGTIAVSHNGTTYYVCCTGCKEAFAEEPEKYIKEFEAKRKK